jgi:hypothetical protein
MADDLDTLQVVLILTWTFVSNLSAGQKHPIYGTLLTGLDVLEDVASTASLAFAPGLLEVLKAAAPPAIAFFKALPSDAVKRWAIYVLVLEKDASRPMIYIGSGTERLQGVSARFLEYRHVHKLPAHVKAAVQNGYKITHKGLLCWAPLPTGSTAPMLRLLFVAMEAAFAFAFWAMRITVKGKDYNVSHVLPWPVSSFSYNGLCSHTSLSETVISDFSLEDGELDQMFEDLKQRRAAKQSVISTNYHFRQLDTNADAYHTRKSTNQKDYAARHPDKVKATYNGVIKKAKDEKRHYCGDCKKAFGKPSELAKHTQSASHKAKVADAKNQTTLTFD